MKKLILTVFTVVLCLGLSAWAQKVNATIEPASGVDTPGPSQCDTVDGNLVVNCGFEPLALAPWVQSGDLSFSGRTARSAHSGSWGYEAGPVNGLGFIAQNLDTSGAGGGVTYDLSFWLRNAGVPNQFQVFWDNQMIYAQVDEPDFPFQLRSFPGLEVTGDTTELKFGFFNVPDWFFIDDIQVVVSP